MLPVYLMMVGAAPGKVYFSAEDTEEALRGRFKCQCPFQTTQKGQTKLTHSDFVQRSDSGKKRYQSE